MKKMLAMLICGISVLGGCSDDPEDPGKIIKYKEYLIDAYIQPVKLEALWEYESLHLAMDGPVYATWSTGADYSEFLRLAALHGGRIDREVSIQLEVYYIYPIGFAGNYVTYAEDFASIDVTCDQPFDETHPVGSSLNEFCIAAFYTFAPFVRAGNTGYEVVEKVKKLGALTDGDLDMIAHGTLRVVIPPKRFSVPCTYTITVTTESGRTLSAQWNREPTP